MMAAARQDGRRDAAAGRHAAGGDDADGAGAAAHRYPGLAPGTGDVDLVDSVDMVDRTDGGADVGAASRVALARALPTPGRSTDGAADLLSGGGARPAVYLAAARARR